MQQLTWIDALKHKDLEMKNKNPHINIKELQQYFTYYGLDITTFSEYRNEFIYVEDRRLFLQLFTPASCKGIVFIIHGYLDHSAGLARTINRLLQEGYQVAALDLPGHGLSGGASGSIASFDEYVEAAVKAWGKVSPYCANVPLYGLGHSTGAAILFQAACDRKIQFSKMIFAAPLYMPYRWRKLRTGIKLFSRLVPRHKRRFKKNSEDKNYHLFTKNDPLQVKFLQAEWMFALEAWHGRISRCPVYGGEIHLLQGNKDTTVEWKENLKFFREKCQNLRVTLFEGARHQLLNEKDAVRKAVESCIVQSLEDNRSPGS
ncbi:alpha/beta hydrolase [Alkalicoccus saliphilus]|uniref:Serine aminopeptidase S33 domain-containing protein n=1 Tax=Alkalicoccus saliphilus TaxID=200989 RepID=A0A2T4U7W7_9BACI|nr:alpha/beta hydrolase [Alkalicoccus saliphilus]PTL39503.1 hypothetical protein C6Y45_05530 [Alkalicoccus saliphilus]